MESYPFLLIFGVFLFGTVVGSFLNVVILRYNSGFSPFSGRSHCFSCGNTLRWFELVPLLSFLIQKGRCRNCGARISPQYFFVELSTGLLFTFLFSASFDGTLQSLFFTALLFVIFSILIVIFVYDLRHKIIPDGLAYAFAFFALVYSIIPSILSGMFETSIVFWKLGAGPLLFLPFFLLWYFSGGRLMGLGDGKLALGIGWFLGLSGGIAAIILSFWVGTLFVAVLFFFTYFSKYLRFLFRGGQSYFSFLSSGLTMKSEIPFAPFLIIATSLVFFFGNFWILSLFGF